MVKKRIAVIGLKGLPAFGGAATVGENIIEKLKEKYDFTVYAISSHTDKNRKNNGFRQIVFKSIPFKKMNIMYYYIASALHAVVCGHYELIHLHHGDAAFIIMILKLRYSAIMLTTHGAFHLLDKWKKYRWYFLIQEKMFIKYATAVSCVSLKEKRLFKKKINMDVHYIPNGINENKTPYSNDSKKEDRIFFGAGRIVNGKGCDILIKALNAIKFTGKVLIAGDLEQTPKYKKVLIKLSSTLDVDFLGLIKNQKELFEVIRKAKIFVYPSSIEAMSMMLLEAASVKIPIVCSDIIENKDIFSEEEVLFFQTDDINDLAVKIRWALNNNEAMMIKAEKAYKKVVENYRWEKIANQYDGIYQKLMNIGFNPYCVK